MSSEPEQIAALITQVMRWASRRDVRRRLLGPTLESLTPADTWLLGALASRGPMRSTELAAWQGVDKSTVSPQIGRLQRLGLIERTPDPADRRAALLALTRRGGNVHRRMTRAAADVVAEALEGWTEQDRSTLGALLTRFTNELTK